MVYVMISVHFRKFPGKSEKLAEPEGAFVFCPDIY